MVREVAIAAEQVEEVLRLAQEAQDAALRGSNDREIETLRDALEYALALLGLGLPEAREYADDD